MERDAQVDVALRGTKLQAMALADEDRSFEQISLDGLDFAQRYKLLMASVIPRPVALVSTMGEGGNVNLAPFSSYMVASVEEGFLCFSVGPDPKRIKDTLNNVRRTGEFVINSVSEAMAVQVQNCAEEFPPHVSEADEVGFELVNSLEVAPPRVKMANLHFECRLHTIIQFGESHLVVGRIVQCHARTGLVHNYKIDPRDLAPLGRIAGRNYCKLGEIVKV